MRRALTPFAALAVVLSLTACGDPKPPQTVAEPTAADTAAVQQSAVMPEDAPPQEEADATPVEAVAESTSSCMSELGASASARLVERCIAVSPATHPPCNAANPCAMIQGEIDRSCAMYGPDEKKPAECAG